MAMPTATQLPQYFRECGYLNPWDSQKSPFSFAFGAEFWSWLKQNPEQSTVFNRFMASRRRGKPSWFDTYPVEHELVPAGSEFGDDDVLLIDVGGNQGHDLRKLRAKHQHLPGRFILQDLPTVVDDLEFSDQRISAMAHDFFEPQPIKCCNLLPFSTQLSSFIFIQLDLMEESGDKKLTGYCEKTSFP